MKTQKKLETKIIEDLKTIVRTKSSPVNTLTRLNRMSKKRLKSVILILARNNYDLHEEIDNLKTNICVFAPQLKNV